MISIWGTADRAAEAAVKKAGGVKPPRHIVDIFNNIIKTAFAEMSASLNDHNIVLHPMLLEEIQIFEEEILNHFRFFLSDLAEKAKDYNILTKAQAKDEIGGEVRGAFGYLSTLITDCNFTLSDEAKIILRRVERKVFIDMTNNVNTWKYY